MNGEINFKPSDVVLCAPLPLIDTFERAVAEHAAAMIVRALARSKNEWRVITPQEVGAEIKADIEEDKEPFASLNKNPFFRSDFFMLVKLGYAEWENVEGKALKFTDKGIEALRKWVRTN